MIVETFSTFKELQKMNREFQIKRILIINRKAKYKILIKIYKNNYQKTKVTSYKEYLQTNRTQEQNKDQYLFVEANQRNSCFNKIKAWTKNKRD